MLTKQIKLKHGVSELGNLQVYPIIAILILFLFTSLAFAGELMEKQSLRHGVSELGNLQVYPITEIIEDGKIISSTRGQAYTPRDVNNMESFDDKSKEIVFVITDKKVKDDFNLEKQEMTGIGLEKIISYDRIIKESGAIAVRRITRVFKDGVEIDKKYHRSWINPGDNPDDNDIISKAIAEKLHTIEVITEYKVNKEKQKLRK